MLAQVNTPDVNPNLVTQEVQAASARLASLVPYFLAIGFLVLVVPKLVKR